MGVWLVIVPIRDCADAQGAAASPLEPQTHRTLFNGRNLEGWTTWLVDSGYADPRGVFSVSDKVLRISGDGLGYIATVERYTNFHLVVEWRWGARNWPWGDRIGKARDSGIFLHAVGPDGNSHDGRGAFMAAIECNLFQGATGDILLIRGTNTQGELIAPRLTATVAPQLDSDGWPFWRVDGAITNLHRWGRLNHKDKDPAWRDVLDFRGRIDYERPPGEWNRVECICRGDTVRLFVNGTLVNCATNIYPRAGKILLQCEGSEIFFRRVDIWPISGNDPRRD